ncbi:MAG: hypothetical protein NXI04_07245 [Planctomycetaceae bacterium]|nr:hypothetical protein [Planctomycetaceae bacterium]
MQIPRIPLMRSLVAAGLLVGSICGAAEKDAVVIHEYRTQGDHYSAVSIRLNQPGAKSVKRHVVIVDTSASQTGFVGTQSRHLVNEVIRQLSDDSMVALFAADVRCNSLTDGLVSVTSESVADALEMLEMRTPLGSTDLAATFEQISQLADGQPLSVLYVGDGMSASRRLSPEELGRFTNTLVSRNVSFHSVVAGPKASTQLPAVLANLTGGTLSRLSDEVAADAGDVVASLQTAPVAVTSLRDEAGSIKRASSRTAFLRSDRDSVLFTAQAIKGDLTVTTSLRQMTIPVASRVAAGPAIAHLLERVRTSDGVNAATVSLAELNSAENDFRHAYISTLKAARSLERRGEKERATEVFAQVAEMGMFEDPAVILTALQQPPAGGVESLPQPPAGDIDSFQGADNPGDALSAAEAELKVQTERLVQRANGTIDAAREKAFDNPDLATNELKDLLETIRSSENIAPDVQDELDRRVSQALISVTNMREVNEQRSKFIAKEQAILEAQRKRLTVEAQEEQRLAILIDQVRGLLDQARHGDRNGFEDAEGVSRIAIDLEPGNGPATQALVMSESLGQLDKAYRLVNLRHDRFLEVLYQVELSHIPFPDEPPIQYPPADVWRALTLTRVPRYESFDLRTEAPVEKWLSQMLDKPVPLLDFPGETPLSEILEQISTYYTTTWGQDGGASGTDFRMTILPDFAELEIEGIDSLEDVLIRDVNFEGMTLRNALKHIFDQTTEPALTYIIDSEVMLITTETKESETLVTRVYPVADLAIPPIQLGGGGGLGGGGLGGGGLGGGGLGGGGLGGGGQGGFGGGQGGFGGGQGAFSVPPEVLGVLNGLKEDGITTDPLKNVKKKPVLN